MKEISEEELLLTKPMIIMFIMKYRDNGKALELLRKNIGERYPEYIEIVDKMLVLI